MKLLLIATLVSFLASGCASTLKPTTLDPSTGYFPTTTKLSASGIIVKKPFLPKYLAMLYVKTDANNKTYDDFYLTSFSNMNRFQKVVDKTQLESIVVEKKLMGKVSNISDLIGLNNLEKQIGPFLIVEPKIGRTGAYNYEASLRAIDPETGETVLHLQNAAYNWSGLDQPLFFPLLNGFLEWTQNKPISVEAQKTN